MKTVGDLFISFWFAVVFGQVTLQFSTWERLVRSRIIGRERSLNLKRKILTSGSIYC